MNAYILYPFHRAIHSSHAKVFSLSPPPFSPIMFGLNKKSICFPFVYFEYTQALLCAYSRVWCTSSSYNAILEGRNHAFFVLLLSHCFAMKTSLSRSFASTLLPSPIYSHFSPIIQEHYGAIGSDEEFYDVPKGCYSF